MKLIDDTLKGNDGAWDMVRIGAGFAAWAATFVTLWHMVTDTAFAGNIVAYTTALAGLWAGYAAAVWGHSFAKT